MAASDSYVTTAKGRLDKQGGDPDTGYISKLDVQTAMDDLQDGWQADDGTLLPKAGGTMTGALTLSGAPTVGLHAATKTYVDDADAALLPKSGGTMTGAITLPSNPTADLHAATKQYVDSISPPGGYKSVVITVAAANAPSDVKSSAEYVCDGTADQTEINAALAAAATGHDLGNSTGRDTTTAGTFGEGIVQLTGGRFFLTGTITVPTGATLQGIGQATELFADTDFNSSPLIGLTSVNNTNVTIRDMLLNGNYSSGDCAGIFLDNTGGSFSGVFPPTNPDTMHRVINVDVWGTNSHGVRNVGGRGDKFITVSARDTSGHSFYIDSSDSHLIDCIGNPSGGSVDAFYINGGNSVLTHCKGFYSDRHGFNIGSSRATLVGCTAQDNGYYGYYIAGDDCNLTGCVADSNGRLDSSGTASGGVYIGYDQCVITGLSVYDRAQSTYKQMQGIVCGVSGMDEATIHAYVEVPAGGTEVVNRNYLTPIGNVYQITSGSGDKEPWASPAVGFQAYTTAARPTAQYTGHGIFDTTLGYPVWWNGTVWKDAAGTTR